MTKKINLALLVLMAVLLSACNINFMDMAMLEGSGTPTPIVGVNGTTGAAILFNANNGSAVSISGLQPSYKAGDTAKFDLVWKNNSSGTYRIEGYSVRLMNTDPNAPREFSYGTKGDLLLYGAQNYLIKQNVPLPSDLAPGTYRVNVYIGAVYQDNTTKIAGGLTFGQTITVMR